MNDEMMFIVNVAPESLIAAEYNPRVWYEEDIRQLTESIKRFGLIDPIIVNGAESRKGIVIGGHFRLKIARDLGFKTVPVVYVDIPDLSREMELNLRLNRNVGRWNLDLLANMGEDIMKEAGFNKNDLEKLFDVEFPESTEPGAASVEKATCPKCGHEFEVKAAK